ncbi:hypothetical protein KI387_017067, partial [Taxus chinensis]
MPCVFASKRDREARIRRIGEICPRQFGTSEPEVRSRRGEPKKPPMNQNVPRVFVDRKSGGK